MSSSGRWSSPRRLMRWPQTWWQHWWSSRIHPCDEMTFTQRNLYIVPTTAGWGFALVLLVMLLASINEQINLGYALTFMVSGASLMTMHITHANVCGLTLRLLPSQSQHAGTVLTLHVAIGRSSGSKDRFGLELKVSPPVQAGVMHPLDETKVAFEVVGASDTVVDVDLPCLSRGWLEIPRVTLQSRYPLGFFLAWGYWRPRSRVLIWPALDAHAPALPYAAAPDDPAKNRPVNAAMNEAPEGLRAYRRGDPSHWIAWKKSSLTLASHGELISRESESAQTQELWLDWAHSLGLQGLDTEAKLSRLATWVIQAEDIAQGSRLQYGLKLPGHTIMCGQGPSHQKACLDALASWGHS